jgi:nucleoside-diphosphate-sugar epimerase
MRIAITGAAGFIGRSLAERLARRGHEIVALDNNFRGDLALMPAHRSISSRHFDILSSGGLNEIFRDVDAIYHLAAINGTENFYKIPARVVEVGIAGTHNVLKAVLESGIKRFYFASSSEVYGTPAVTPTPETVECRVADVFNPRFSYGGSKLAGELITVNYLRGTNTHFVIFRPHNVYGPQMGHEHVIPQLVKKIIDAVRCRPSATRVTIPLQGSGLETRAFIYIDDCTRAIEMATLQNPDSGLIHIGTEEEISIRELALQIGRILGLELATETTPISEGSPVRRCPDTTKLRRLGFKPDTPLPEGLEMAVRWYADYYRRQEEPTK